ncbi:MAG: hypothetical protein HQM09_04620 [Candidatus Riflebacteria bacterium]|nr:hypothetical protein [Candidatus Riflebacteria bacterium]
MIMVGRDRRARRDAAARPAVAPYLRTFNTFSLWRKWTRGFTLMEVVIMGALLIFVSGTLYKIFSGTWMNFFKTQTKLTNLRSASLLLEHLKHDIRLSMASTKAVPQPTSISSSSLSFNTTDLSNTVKNVSYTFSGGMFKREDGSRVVNQAKISSFVISLDRPGTQTCLQILIEVDAEKDEVKRSENSTGNKIKLGASLYPRFLQNSGKDEEKFWWAARGLTGTP